MTAANTAELVHRAQGLARGVLAQHAEKVDAEALWPAESLRAIADAGLLGLHVPERLGGHAQGLGALLRITEELALGCSSTAMCYGMHCVASAVIVARATPYQEQRYLAPIAQGRHFTTLSLSEPGTGVHFYLPRVTFRATGRGFVLKGEKSFITNGGYADSYVVSAVADGDDLDPGTFSCLLVDAETTGLEWGPPWSGFGMRGNASRGLRLNLSSVPSVNLLGSEGDQVWYVFEVIAPYFLAAMTGVYLGVAQGALELATAHLKSRIHDHTGQRLSHHAVLVEQIADMWRKIERTRQLAHHAARLGDEGAPNAGPALFAAKIDVAETAVEVTTAAMSLMGGRGFQQGGTLARLLRDAQAAHVMAPTTHLLKTWLGRSALGEPLL
ncbi:acyl-CoA dehydrogenase family protein [Phenylobacterium sp.]|uniref:acyl-CoA dehydrogenase family protein n=1 Tax=Phenylobacterium sp. TaxID=1871053 RepID=UPI0028122764|nr:acyl-CoA dehydrogenase family protein [Phenylobacterium sp.]